MALGWTKVLFTGLHYGQDLGVSQKIFTLFLSIKWISEVKQRRDWSIPGWVKS